jgi:hypothetical protein
MTTLTHHGIKPCRGNDTSLRPPPNTAMAVMPAGTRFLDSGTGSPETLAKQVLGWVRLGGGVPCAGEEPQNVMR